jgi:RHS repeat-associated protein
MTKKEVALTVGSPITSFSTAIVTEWGFDENNRLTSFKDDAGNTSTWAYDAKDRQTSMSYPNSTSIAYVYDGADNVTQVTDAAGNVISDTYDALNRNTARSISLATGFIGTTSESRSFDALNRTLTNDNNDYKLTYTYGVRGLGSTVYEEKQEYATGTAYQKVVTTKYDAVGNRTYMAYPSGLTLTYAYNDINALSSVTDGTNTIASFTYYGVRPKVTTFGNSTTATFTYAGFREDVTTIHHETSTPTTLVRLDYGYNKLHDRTYERYGTSGSPGDAFEYDKARRLTKAWMGSSTPSSPSGNTYVKTIVYNMDDDGNRTSVVTTPYGGSSATESYTTNTLNQYTAVGGTSQTYDGNGNLTDNGTYKFKYDYKNQIREARLTSNNNLVATYTFDASGCRVGKAVSGGVTERYILADVETVEVFDGSNTWKQDYVFDVTGIDRVLMLEQADVLDQDGDSNTAELTRNYYHRNAIGSVMVIGTAAQAEAATYRYAPYGEVEIARGGVPVTSDPLGQALGHAARWHDVESGTSHTRKRAQSLALGRFTQRDRLSRFGSDELYEYCESSPLNAIDPIGESEVWIPNGPPTIKETVSDAPLYALSDKPPKIEYRTMKQQVKIGENCFEQVWLVKLTWNWWNKFRVTERWSDQAYWVYDTGDGSSWDSFAKAGGKVTSRVPGLDSSVGAAIGEIADIGKFLQEHTGKWQMKHVLTQLAARLDDIGGEWRLLRSDLVGADTTRGPYPCGGHETVWDSKSWTYPNPVCPGYPPKPGEPRGRGWSGPVEKDDPEGPVPKPYKPVNGGTEPLKPR